MPTLDSVPLDRAHPPVAAAITAHLLNVKVVACDGDLADTKLICEAYGIAIEDSANTLVVIGKGTKPAPLAACLVLASTRLRCQRYVKRQLGTRKASFAPQELACAVTENCLIRGLT